jgi:GntR family galactonate operon transcriptional repressor
MENRLKKVRVQASRASAGAARAVSLASDSRDSGSEISVLYRLGREIVGGVFEPDARLPDEPAMLRRYSVSRTALREAYSKLAAKGMIVARPKVGTAVRPQAYWNMLDPDVLNWHLQMKPAGEIAKDLYTIRRMVEPAAAALAAENRSADELAKIEAAFHDMIEHSNDESSLVEADLRFHLEVLFATHNYFIGAFSPLIHAAMISTFRLSWRGAAKSIITQDRLDEHGNVLKAIRDKNGSSAKKRMETLLDGSIYDVREALYSDDDR